MRYVRSLLIMLALVMAIGAGAAWVVYDHYAADLPDFEQLADYQPPTVTRVHAGDGRLLAEYATQRRVFVPIKAMPPRLIEAVLAAEDRDFYAHGGVNFGAIARAALTNLLHAGSGRRPLGASTITQQVAKNMLLGNEYSLSRKIKEAILAVRMEQALSKDRILELYLNEIYFGQGAYGVAAAALNYFNKSLDQLDIAECAFLASLPKGPSNYDPIRHYEAAKARRDWVLDGMEKINAIGEAELKEAVAEPITLRRRDETEVFSAPWFSEEVRRELIQRFGEKPVYEAGLSVRTSLDPVLQVYADRALRNGLIAYDRKHGWRGAVAHLELAAGDRRWHEALAAVPAPAGAAPWRIAVVRELRSEGALIGLADGTSGWLPMSELAWARPTLEDQRVGPTPRTPDQVLKRGDVVLVEPVEAPAQPKGAKPAAEKLEPYGLRQIPDVSGALVALDPHTGRVLALVGGWSYEMSQFNRAVQAKRQIGSTMKPFIYLAALENGMTPSTLIQAAPVAIEQGPGLPLWRPRNFEGEEFAGPKPLRYAIEHSINTMTVRMAASIGIDKIAPYVERLGIMDKMPLEYSMVLGAGETTPLRLTTAYAMLVNGGKRITPSLIDRVQDREGKTIFKHDARACPRCGDFSWPPPGEVPTLPDDREQVLDPGTAYQMVNILEGVVQRGTAAASVGAKLKMPLAGKTGTTNDAADTWFVGFSPDLAVGVYVGFDQPRTLGPGEQGARTAAPVFTAFMADALKDKPPVDFRIPPDVRLVRVDAASGRLAGLGDRNVIWEAFKPGSEPAAAAESSEEVVEGGAGLETVPVDNAPVSLAPTANMGPGVLMPPGAQPRGPAPAGAPTNPSTETGGLY